MVNGAAVYSHWQHEYLMTAPEVNRPIIKLKRPVGAAPIPVKSKSKSLSDWWPHPHEPHFSWVIPHPTKGSAFCTFPETHAYGHTFEAAEVFLLYGKHWDRNKGFGALHILEGHYREIGLETKTPSLFAVAKIAEFVASICAQGAKITCEFSSLSGNHRPLIVRGFKGTVVLDFKKCNETGIGYYSVVTAMATTKAKGSVIGAL